MGDHMPAMIERQHPRFPVHLAIGFSGDQFGMGTLLDLSSGGCLLESIAALHAGDCVTLRVQLSMESSLLTVNAATVVWAQNRRFGLSFTRTVPAERERLHGYLQTLNVAASKRVLLVMEGDDPAQLLIEKLQPLGCMIKTARDGLAALKEAHRFRPHLIILDIAIQGGGGLSIIQRLKRSIDMQDIPIIVLTPSSDAGIIERALSLGVMRYLLMSDGIDVCIEEAKSLLTLSA
jgi:CheY-like chemotaxis protein